MTDKEMSPPLVWAGPTRAARGPQPAHSRDRIAEAAVTIADAEGFDAVSMRRVAAEIGTRATSLYRYVRAKEELLELMVDRAWGESRVPARAGDWRGDLRAIAQHIRAVINAHPWMIAISARAALGPNSIAVTEASLAAIDGHGLDADGMLMVATAVSTFARGWAAQEVAERQAETRSGLDRARWMAGREQYGRLIHASGEYPRFSRIIDEARTPHDPALVRQGFEQGLECLLDGVGARLS